jgi:hypothetical protein
VTEQDLQRCVIETAQLFGYVVAHFRAAKTSAGWRTPVQADGAGFPDLVMAKPGRLLFAELKSARGPISPAQTVWLETLSAAGAHVEVYVWRPADWLSGVIENTLRDPGWLARLRAGAA